MSFGWPWDICYASANIKALETLGYAEHTCNYVVILDSWVSGKITQFWDYGAKPGRKSVAFFLSTPRRIYHARKILTLRIIYVNLSCVLCRPRFKRRPGKILEYTKSGHKQLNYTKYTLNTFQNVTHKKCQKWKIFWHLV